MLKPLSVVGTHVERVDAKAKVTGDAVYTVDVKLPHMQFAKYIRSPHAHARVLSIDTGKALALEGVTAVVTMLELCGKPLHNDILDDCVRYHGEAVAGVAAVTEEIAQAAARLIEVQYEPLPAVFTVEESLAAEAPILWPGTGNVCKSGVKISEAINSGGPSAASEGPTVNWQKGDPAAGFAAADVIVENIFHTQAQFHCCFEPHACVAHWDRGQNEMNLWLSTQCLYEEQEHLAAILELPMEKVHIISMFVGGGFGGKVHNTCKEYALTALLSRKLRKPVRYIPTRAEETISALRHPARFYYKLGAKKDGTLTALELKAERSGGAHTSIQTFFLLGSTDFVGASYLKCANIKYEGWSVYTNLPPCAAYRGFGYFESGTALMQTVDILAEKLGMDVTEFLAQNVPERGYYIGASQGPITNAGIKATIEKTAAKIDWRAKWHKPGVKKLPDGRLHGMALAFAIGRAYLAPNTTTGNAIMELATDGKAHLTVGITDIGQGQVTGLVQIAAEALGVPFDDVTITWGDSRAPHSSFLSASATTVITGNAVRLAAEDARRQILELAAPLMGLRAEFLDVINGFVQHRSVPDKKIPLADIIKLPGVKTVVGTGKWFVSEEEATPRSLMVSAVEVAVDTETGQVQLLNMVQGTDCGRIISKSRIEGQMQGVLSGGMGFVLMEDWELDGPQRRILNANFLDYKMPAFTDTMGILQPDIILEDDDPVGPFGARGMGEATLSAAGPAILNAVYNAIGVRFAYTPLTPDRVLKALQGGQA